MSLAERLAAEIAANGPISVSAFMERCLHDPTDGYYATRPALGAEGDFITAPLVSQMFGELIGLWAVEAWNRLDRPSDFLLVEMGPGDGTLMADALRAARLVPEFLDAAHLVLVETSAPLRALQAGKLTARWIDRLDALPADGGPVILIANELLDCLPADQFVRTDLGLTERRVGVDADGRLAFVGPRGPVWEVSRAQCELGAQVGALIGTRGGVALFLDYGRDAPGPGDTLQALLRHEKVDPLATAGEADLTVWADFPAFAGAARAPGAQASAILTQGEFLRRLGVEQRARALARARPNQADVIGRQLERLIGDDQMGTLFKACAIHQNGFVPPGFEETP